MQAWKKVYPSLEGLIHFLQSNARRAIYFLTVSTILEPSEQQEIVRNHGWSSNHSKNQKESMKYPVPPSKDGIPQKRKKRRRPYSSNDICHPRVRDADQENNQNPSGRPRYAKSANSKVFGNNKARRLRQRPVNYDNNRMNLKS